MLLDATSPSAEEAPTAQVTAVESYVPVNAEPDALNALRPTMRYAATDGLARTTAAWLRSNLELPTGAARVSGMAVSRAAYR